MFFLRVIFIGALLASSFSAIAGTPEPPSNFDEIQMPNVKNFEFWSGSETFNMYIGGLLHALILTNSEIYKAQGKRLFCIPQGLAPNKSASNVDIKDAIRSYISKKRAQGINEFPVSAAVRGALEEMFPCKKEDSFWKGESPFK